MPREPWIIVVVDAHGRLRRTARLGAPACLVASGVSVQTAARWAQVRRQMSPKGLARKLRAVRN